MTTNQFENCISLSNTQRVRNINEGGEKPHILPIKVQINPITYWSHIVYTFFASFWICSFVLEKFSKMSKHENKSGGTKRGFNNRLPMTDSKSSAILSALLY